MPGNLFMTDSTFPVLKENENLKEQVRKLYNYVYMLNEQLRYTLANLGVDNFNNSEIDTLIKTITQPVMVRLEDSEKGVSSKIDAFADSIRLSVGNNEDGEVSITLFAGEKSRSISLTGVVSFKDIENDSSGTIINGSLIKTGKIDAERIDVDGLHVKRIYGAGNSNETFYAELTPSEDTYNGNPGGEFTVYGKNSDGSFSPAWGFEYEIVEGNEYGSLHLFVVDKDGGKIYPFGVSRSTEGTTKGTWAKGDWHFDEATVSGLGIVPVFG